jgi:benzoate-CoA ligase
MGATIAFRVTLHEATQQRQRLPFSESVPKSWDNSRLVVRAAIAECAVVGRADALGLVRPVAFIVLRGGLTNPAGGLDSEIIGWLHTRLVGFKCPHEFRFVSDLPKTATGKIQRFLLRSS